MDLLSIFNIDFSGVRISYNGESLFREINGSMTSWWTVINDFNHNASTLARLWHAQVCSPDAFDSITSPTSCPIAPYYITCCSDHHAIVLISVAWRGCQWITNYIIIQSSDSDAFISNHIRTCKNYLVRHHWPNTHYKKIGHQLATSFVVANIIELNVFENNH